MKHSRLLILAAMAAFSTATSTVSAQDDVNYKKYPDFSPRLKVDKKLVATKSATERPDHVNNAETIYFPCYQSGRWFLRFGFAYLLHVHVRNQLSPWR